MAYIAKGVPCRFDAYWRILSLKSCLWRVLEEGHFGRKISNGYFDPVGTAGNEEFLCLDSIEGEMD
jgi:hypothetical protein